MAATIGTGRTTCFGCVNSFAPKDQCSLDTQLDVTNKRSSQNGSPAAAAAACLLYSTCADGRASSRSL